MGSSGLTVLPQNGFAHAMRVSDVPWPENATGFKRLLTELF